MQKMQPKSIRRRSTLFVRFCGVVFVLFFSLVGAASAQSIAFFPLLDLSVDSNGINSRLTERLRQELIHRGKTIIPAENIMRFLIRYRIRTLGKLTTYQTSLVRKELEADLVLQGTIYQLEDEEKPVLSLTLQLSRTLDGRIVWSHTENLSYADQTSLLGLEDPHDLEDLYKPFFTGLLATMQEDIETQGELLSDTLNIDTVSIHPKFLRPGENVSCKIRVRKSINMEESQPELSLHVGERQYHLIPDEDGYYFESSWTTEEKAGSYPVNLVAKWPSGVTQQGVIGSYSVDDHEPGIRLLLIATERDGAVLFSDKLIIIPKLVDPEPIIRWEVTVTDESGEVIVLMDATGHIPKSLTWWGQTSMGTPAKPGEHSILFKVWDRAERESSAEAMVKYMPELPEVLVEVTQEQNRLLVALDTLSETPLNFWWAKFYEENGHLLKLVQGRELPVSIELDVNSEQKQKIECLLTARDFLGNQYRKNISNLLDMREDDEETESSIETEWVEEF